MRLALSLKNARLNLILAALDGAGLPGEVWLLDGAPPATQGSLNGATVQCVFTLPRPSGTVAAGVLTLASNLEALRSAGGTIGWGVLVDGSGTIWADFTASLPAGSGDLKLNSLLGATGSVVRLVGGTLTE